jgi:AcrR family transcriptional regulator
VKRSTLTEQQKCVALLVATGQHTYQRIAQMAHCHFNTVTRWVNKDERFQALVQRFQENIAQKLQDLAVESTFRDNSSLMQQAVQTLEAFLHSGSSKKQMQAIDFLLGGALQHQPERAQERPQPERLSLIRLTDEIMVRHGFKQS